MNILLLGSSSRTLAKKQQELIASFTLQPSKHLERHCFASDVEHCSLACIHLKARCQCTEPFEDAAIYSLWSHSFDFRVCRLNLDRPMKYPSPALNCRAGNYYYVNYGKVFQPCCCKLVGWSGARARPSLKAAALRGL